MSNRRHTVSPEFLDYIDAKKRSSATLTLLQEGRISQPPRRSMPFLYRLKWAFRSMGFPASLFFVVAIGFALIFFSLQENEAQALIDSGGEWKTTTGSVKTAELRQRTTSEGSSKKRADYYYYEYSYSVEGKSYDDSQSSDDDQNIKAGGSAEIEYFSTQPATSRLKGTRDHESMGAFFFYVLFGLWGIALIALFITFLLATRRLKLLQNGIFVEAECIKFEPIDYGSMQRPPLFPKAYFTFVFTTSKGEKIQSRQLAEINFCAPDRKEVFLYLPDSPNTNSFFDNEFRPWATPVLHHASGKMKFEL